MPEGLTPSDKELIPLPKRKIIGKRPGDEQLVEEIFAKEKLFIPSEVEKTPERVAQIEAIYRSLLEFGRARGVDLSERIPAVDKIHFLDEESFSKVVEHYDLPRLTDGYMHHETGDILVKDNPNEGLMLAAVGHELVHTIAHESVNLRRRFLRKSRLEFSRHGFANMRNDVFQYFTEAIIEMTNLDIISNFWPRQEALRGLDIRKPTLLSESGLVASFEPQLIVVDSVLRKTAHRQGLTYRQYFETLERSLFLGDMSSLRPIAQYLGPQGIKTLSRLPLEYEKAREYARDLGLENALDKFQQMERGESVSILEGLDDPPGPLDRLRPREDQ